MAYDEKLVARVRELLSGRRGLAEKKMFGGIGFLVGGNMTIGVLNKDLIVRVGADNHADALSRAHVREFDITGRAMNGWVMVAPRGTSSRQRLEGWVQRGVEFAASLPAKGTRRPRPKKAPSKPRVEPRMHARLARKGVDRERLAREVMAKPVLIDDAIDGLSADVPAIKYGCGKILRVVAEQRPELLYPHFARFRELLSSDNNIMQWEGIHVIGHLAPVDDRGKIARMLDRYLAPLPGPVLVTAANVIDGAGRIGAAKPRLADRIATALLGVSRARYRTPECRNVALGKVIEALDRLFPNLRDRAPALAMVRRLRKNPRPSTRKKAEKFLARWSGAKSR